MLRGKVVLAGVTHMLATGESEADSTGEIEATFRGV